MRILIVRHGDPDYENDTLTEKGKREATLLAEKLKKEKIDYFYSSPLGRAKDTCMYVARAMGREKDVAVMPFLREFDRPKSVVLPNGEEKVLIWDLLPEFWTKQEDMYDRDNWANPPCFGCSIRWSRLKSRNFKCYFCYIPIIILLHFMY